MRKSVPMCSLRTRVLTWGQHCHTQECGRKLREVECMSENRDSTMTYSDLQNCLNVLQFCVSMPISQSDLHQIMWLKMRWKAVLLEFPTHVQSRNLYKIWWICQLFFDLSALRQFCNCYLIPHPHGLPLWNFVSGGGNKLCNCYNGPTVVLLRL